MTRDTFNPSAFVDELKKLNPRAEYEYPGVVTLPSTHLDWTIYATPFFDETDTVPIAASHDEKGYEALGELDTATIRDAAHYLELVTAAVKGQTIVPGLEVAP